jgi:hypothetical protein
VVSAMDAHDAWQGRVAWGSQSGTRAFRVSRVRCGCCAYLAQAQELIPATALRSCLLRYLIQLLPAAVVAPLFFQVCCAVA